MRFLSAACYLALLAVLGVFLFRGQPGLSEDVARQPARFEVGRAMAHLRRIDVLSQEAGGRTVGSIGHAAARSYLAGELRGAGLHVEEQKFVDPLGGPMDNIIATLPGDREEVVLISAHHDAGGPGPSAVEGSVGMAILLELARASAVTFEEARREGRRPSRTLVFASWDGASLGCAGSSWFVKSLPKEERRKLRAVISLDSIGWKDGAPILHVLPYRDRFGVETTAPDWLVTRVTNAARARGERVAVGDRWLGLVYQVLVQSVDVGYYSDDRPFLARGVPAVFVSNFSLTRSYPALGTEADTIDQVGEAQVASSGRSLEAAVVDLVTSERLPAGEARYLVLQPPFGRAYRLTGDQVKTLAILGLLPGSIVLIRRRREGGLTTTRALFFAFAALFACATLRSDPILFSVLFGPALLAGPLLAVRSPGAVWAHLLCLIPPFFLAALVIPVYLTGSASLVRLQRLELAAIGALAALGLAQAVLHHGRMRPRRRDPIVQRDPAPPVVPLSVCIED